MEEIKMKKLFAALLTALLIFSPVGSTVFQDQPTTVEAKGYKSGKKSFKSNNNTTTNNNSIFQNKKDTTTKSTTTAAKKPFKPSGLMKGLMIGGLAGLLFGSLFANMGMLGSILGLMINVLAIVVLISVIRKIYVHFRNKRREAEANTWRN
jgi:predicted lipid-binding transport protein (Tim44 family)